MGLTRKEKIAQNIEKPIGKKKEKGSVGEERRTKVHCVCHFKSFQHFSQKDAFGCRINSGAGGHESTEHIVFVEAAECHCIKETVVIGNRQLEAKKTRGFV